MEDVRIAAGGALDALVAEKVMGWTYWKTKRGNWAHSSPDGKVNEEPAYGLPKFDPQTGEKIKREWWDGADIPPYSTDIAAAWEVLERICAGGREVRINCVTGGGCVENMTDDGYPLSGWDRTLCVEEHGPIPHAICLAALKAVGVSPTPSPRTATGDAR